MKKKCLFLCVTLLSVFALTSCFEGENTAEGQALGVLDYGKNRTPVLISSIGPVSSPSFDALILRGDMSIGGCYIISYLFNRDLPENSSGMYEANGYYTVSLNGLVELPTYNMEAYVADTSFAFSNEIAVSNVYEDSEYLGGHLFIYQIVSQPSDLKLEWSMSYDETIEPTEEAVGRYYDVFVRATKMNSSENSNVNMQHLNAYNMGSYLKKVANKEKSLLGSNYVESSSMFKLRFNYVSAIDKDTQKVTWKSHEESVLISFVEK